ncbi:VIT domain-containing protein [Pseudoduganella violaceinigra]|uniref:VIT domain-containing protein n=1 Tax=Pseudoduganella violaceinigra TaxID=246602 RepID=UPI0005531BF4|nr:VIT domain-containing protein [Pseudoduganella violaceinigra]
MLARLIFVLCMLFCGTALAQMPPPLIRTHINGGEKPVQVQSAAVQTVISGGMAETSVKLVFYNPNPRQLEGDLQFPLGEGEQVTGFSLDVEGEMRPAVPVGKERGRQILEAEERRRVDPALLEQTQGNNFKLRIYPIPGRGTRTVELKYAAMLARQQKSWSYRLPLKHFSVPVSLDLRVMGGEEAPVAVGLPERFSPADGGWQLAASKTKGEVLVRVAAAQDKPRSYIEEFNGQQYFMAEVPVPAERKPRPLPKVIGVLWDSSGSGAHRALAAELRVLASYLDAAGSVEVRLVRLRDKAEPVKVFKLAKGQSGTLVQELESTIYDGASALADWQPQADVDEYLLFSDGLRNYGNGTFPQLGKACRLYTLSSSAGADAARLSAWAGANGGRYIAIDPVDAQHASQELLTEGVRVAGVSGMPAGDIVVDDGQAAAGLLRVAGKVQGTAALVLALENQGRKSELVVEAGGANSIQHPLAAWWWANRRIAQLEGNYELNRAAIRRIGLEFGLPTRETSLLVLERLEDYVRHDVTPPQKYIAAFEKMRAENRGLVAEQRAKHLDNVVREFAAKVAWWEKPFPKERPPAPKKEKSGSDDMRMVPEAEVMAPPPPALAAPMARMPAAPSAAAAEPAGKMDKADAAPINGGATVRLKAWQPDAPYTARMRKAAVGDMYRIYLDERPSHVGSSAFLLDVAGLMLERGQRELGLRVLSNLAEMELENRHVLRVLAYRLMEASAPKLAVPLLERVQELAEEEPQSFRDLGLALAASAQEQRAIEQLYQVVLRPWDGRFADVELIALSELNAIVARAKAAGRTLDTRSMDSRLLRNLPVDLRVVLTWDADNSDMDLHVIDPDGERAYYGHRLTYQGGRMSLDFTGGYGPEEFMLRHAKPGIYRVEVNYFGSAQQIVTGATTLQLHFTTGFGTQKADDKMVTLRLKGQGSTVLVGEFEVKPK